MQKESGVSQLCGAAFYWYLGLEGAGFVEEASRIIPV